MKVLGIIAEYNPFHNGHLFHLEQSKKLTGAEVSVAVMSGNFVQRGEPAVLNKWIRSEMAVRNGVDLVLELPFAYACNNAEIFAKGSIRLLDGLGCIDTICFGSESGDIDTLHQVACVVTEKYSEYSDILKEKMKKGISYSQADQDTLSELTGPQRASLVSHPNNTLGIEYLKELIHLKSRIKPATIKRKGASPDGINRDEKIAGATAIRKMIDKGDVSEIKQYLPVKADECVEENKDGFANYQMFREILIYSIISKSEQELADIYTVTEGLENRILKFAKEASSVKHLISLIKTKRYTETRIKRILIHVLMGLKREIMTKILNENQMYTRVLSFSEKGAALLKKIKNDDSAGIPVITNISKESQMLTRCTDLLSYDTLASDIFNLAVGDSIYDSSDYRQVPAFIKQIK